MFMLPKKWINQIWEKTTEIVVRSNDCGTPSVLKLRIRLCSVDWIWYTNGQHRESSLHRRPEKVTQGSNNILTTYIEDETWSDLKLEGNVGWDIIKFGRVTLARCYDVEKPENPNELKTSWCILRMYFTNTYIYIYIRGLAEKFIG